MSSKITAGLNQQRLSMQEVRRQREFLENIRPVEVEHDFAKSLLQQIQRFSRSFDLV